MWPVVGFWFALISTFLLKRALNLAPFPMTVAFVPPCQQLTVCSMPVPLLS
jgi:hypothetical protein